MKIKHLFIIIWSIAIAIVPFFTSCTTDSDDIDIPITSDKNYLMPIIDWNAKTDEIKNNQNENYVMTSLTDNIYLFEYSGEEDIIISYQFDDDDNLQTSSIIMPNNNKNTSKIKNLLKGFNYIGDKNSHQIYSNTSINTAAMLLIGTGNNGKEYISLCFNSYTPSTNEDDENLPYVDLGLSVKWAKCNVNASSPEKTGGFYSWSEITTKPEYWRENYSYCNNVNQYSFKYTNPLANITGTKYDVATSKMGEGWRMPTRDEALELIYSCTWEQETINNITGAKITGPNGNNIFIPNTGYKKQRQEAASYMTHLWTSEAPSRSDEDAYTISISTNKNTEPELDIIWKAWGLQIRAVFEE